MQTVTDRDERLDPTGSSAGPAAKRRKLGVVLGVAIALLVVAIGLVAAKGGSSGGGHTVNAGLSEWAVSFDHTTLRPGKYTLKIANNGKVEHELIAFRTSLAPDALANDPDGRTTEAAPC